MDRERAEKFLKALAVKQVTVGSRWVSGTCPMARWTHSSGRDKNPSFGMAVADGGRSHWNCFTCGGGSPEELLQTLELYYKNIPDHGLDFPTAREVMAWEKENIAPLPPFMEHQHLKDQQFQEWPEYAALEYPLVDQMMDSHKDAVEYLRTRDVHGVREDQWHTFDLRWDEKERRIISPFRNVYGKLAGLRGRSVDKQATGWKKHFDYPWNEVRNTRLVWFNEQSLQLDGPVVVVEGQFDCMRVAEHFPKVVANLTALPTPPKLARLLHSPMVVLIADGDATGEKSRVEYRNFCKLSNLPFKELLLAENVDPSMCHPAYLAEQLVSLGLNSVPY